MSAHILLATISMVPASTLVAVGVLGVLSAGLRRRSAPAQAAKTSWSGSFVPMPRETPADSPDDKDAPDDSPRAAAHRSLDVWSGRPRAEWRALNELVEPRDGYTIRSRQVAELILEGVIAHRAEPFDAWLVRDLAQTAWQMSPDDGTVMSPAAEATARRIVEQAALALLVRDWLPAADFRLLIQAATP